MENYEQIAEDLIFDEANETVTEEVEETFEEVNEDVVLDAPETHGTEEAIDEEEEE